MAVHDDKTIFKNFTSDTESDTLHVTREGVLVLDAARNAGDITLSLQIKATSGGTFVQARDASGDAITANISSSLPHWHVEFVMQSGMYYKVVGTDASSANVDCRFGRATAY